MHSKVPTPRGYLKPGRVLNYMHAHKHTHTHIPTICRKLLKHNKLLIEIIGKFVHAITIGE